MSTFAIFLVLILIVAFLLVVVIMVQNPKGGGLSSSFGGGGGGGGQAGGVQSTTSFLDKSTWALATLLLVLILLSNFTIMNENAVSESKVIGGDQIENTVPKTVPAPAQNPTGETPTE